MNTTKNMTKSYLAGILIGIGVIVLLVSPNIIVGSIFFSFGLLAIKYFNLNLFTGKVGFQKNTFLEYAIMLFSNWFGCLSSVLLYISAKPELYNILKSKAELKFSQPVPTFWLLGIICGALIYLAVKGKNEIITILAISIFILIGAEHCVVDFVYCLCLSFPHLLSGLIKLCCVIFGNCVGAIFINDLFKIIEEGEINE